MIQYVGILDKVPTLPFFIDISSIKNVKPRKGYKDNLGFRIYQTLLFPIRVVFKFLIWRPIVRLFIEIHIKSKLHEISRAYIRLLQTIDVNKKGNLVRSNWISKARVNCDAFASTLFSWTSLNGIFAWLVNILFGIFLVKNGFDNIPQFLAQFDWTKGISSIFLSIAGILLVSVTYGFLIFTTTRLVVCQK